MTCLIGGVHLTKLKVETTKQVECTTKTKDGDTLRMHYTVCIYSFILLRINWKEFCGLFFQGFLEDGTEFDSSYRRGHPLTFKIGVGNVSETRNFFRVKT